MTRKENIISEDNSIKLKLSKEYNKNDIVSMFKREVPNNKIYEERLNKEIDMIFIKKVIWKYNLCFRYIRIN